MKLKFPNPKLVWIKKNDSLYLALECDPANWIALITKALYPSNKCKYSWWIYSYLDSNADDLERGDCDTISMSKKMIKEALLKHNIVK